MKFYTKHILPKLTNWVCSQNEIRHLRKKVIPLAKGRILEVGIGSGLNLPYYDPVKVERIWGLDPSPQLTQMAKAKTTQLPYDVEFLSLSAENIPLDKNSVDTVLVTYTLCSIPNVVQALNEMNRVLKPGGELIFCEHGKTPDDNINGWQDVFNPIWTKLSGGCNLNRPIGSLIIESRFRIVFLDTKYISPLKMVSFNYSGIAVPI